MFLFFQDFAIAGGEKELGPDQEKDTAGIKRKQENHPPEQKPHEVGAKKAKPNPEINPIYADPSQFLKVAERKINRLFLDFNSRNLNLEIVNRLHSIRTQKIYQSNLFHSGPEILEKYERALTEVLRLSQVEKMAEFLEDLLTHDLAHEFLDEILVAIRTQRENETRPILNGNEISLELIYSIYSSGGPIVYEMRPPANIKVNNSFINIELNYLQLIDFVYSTHLNQVSKFRNLLDLVIPRLDYLQLSDLLKNRFIMLFRVNGAHEGILKPLINLMVEISRADAELLRVFDQFVQASEEMRTPDIHLDRLFELIQEAFHKAQNQFLENKSRKDLFNQPPEVARLLFVLPNYAVKFGVPLSRHEVMNSLLDIEEDKKNPEIYRAEMELYRDMLFTLEDFKEKISEGDYTTAKLNLDAFYLIRQNKSLIYDKVNEMIQKNVFYSLIHESEISFVIHAENGYLTTAGCFQGYRGEEAQGDQPDFDGIPIDQRIKAYTTILSEAFSLAKQLGEDGLKRFFQGFNTHQCCEGRIRAIQDLKVSFQDEVILRGIKNSSLQKYPLAKEVVLHQAFMECFRNGKDQKKEFLEEMGYLVGRSANGDLVSEEDLMKYIDERFIELGFES
jgi:hypothetical protein